MKPGKFFVAVLFTAIFAAACSENTTSNSVANTNVMQTPATPRPAATINELASGRSVFEQNCAVCHNADGTGGKREIEGKTLNVDDLTSEKIKGFSDEKIIGYILNGVVEDGMPAFKDKLSEGEIRDVVKFIRTEFHNK